MFGNIGCGMKKSTRLISAVLPASSEPISYPKPMTRLALPVY
jgi:hypothetical protein